ncbi:MAG: hypothetical protein HY057_00925 [Rhodospirillales bacterium]|nr:hypothetical protein [Rhodospirillales bacterium]
MTPTQIVLALVAFERLSELVIARRNESRLRAAGAVEHGASQYPWVVLLHGGWLAALILTVPADAPLDWIFLGVYLFLQVGRVWVMTSLGRFWTTRVLTLPGAPLVAKGPYRFVRHPNYIVVAGEIAVLPLVFDAWQIALVFSLLNFAFLRVRIRLEDEVLAGRRALTRPEN